MSEPLEWDDACRWLELRKSAICAAWSKVFTDILGGQSGWSLELRVRLMMPLRSKRGPRRLHVVWKPGPVADDAPAHWSLGVRPANSLNGRYRRIPHVRLLGEKLIDEEGLSEMAPATIK